METLTFPQFAARYCERQEQTPEGLLEILRDRVQHYCPDGFMLLECQMLDSSSLGELTIMPVGPNNTYKTVPAHPVSPRGLASDMSVAKYWLPASEVPVKKKLDVD
jgi:hypothetical protein